MCSKYDCIFPFTIKLISRNKINLDRSSRFIFKRQLLHIHFIQVVQTVFPDTHNSSANWKTADVHVNAMKR